MKIFSKTCLAIGIFISTTLSSYIIYKELSILTQYKDVVSGIASDYKNFRIQRHDFAKEKSNSQKVNTIKQPKTTNLNQITNIVNNYAQRIDGEISIYYKDIETNESVSINEDKKYYMASLYKIILVLYLLDEIKSGRLDLDETIESSNTTIEVALEKIITVSNNEYAIALADQYGWFNIENEMKKKLGIEFSFDSNLAISIKNVGILLEEIVRADKIAKSNSEYILDLLGKQQRRSKLPKYLPSNVLSHNKTGELEDYSHDAGIFYTPQANYILAFMSKTKEPLETNEQMALMSKEIYETQNP